MLFQHAKWALSLLFLIKKKKKKKVSAEILDFGQNGPKSEQNFFKGTVKYQEHTFSINIGQRNSLLSEYLM